MARRADQIQYDRTVAGEFPELFLTPTGQVTRKYHLRYGRNPGSTAAFYTENTEGPCIANARIVKEGKDPGWINLEDGDRALRVAKKLRRVFPHHVSAAVIKHEIPSGAARGDSPYEAFNGARDGDYQSGFGGVVALSEQVDRETAEAMRARRPIEWVISPGYSGAAMDVLGETGIRLFEVDSFDTPYTGPNLEVKRVEGGYLVGQGYDSKIVSRDQIEVKFGDPTAEDFDAAILNWLACGLTKSNSVVVGDDHKAHGIGAGQTKRVDAARLALYKAAGGDSDQAWMSVADDSKLEGGLVAASDAFWPFPDGPELLGRKGVRGCIYPTGSNKDNEVFDAFRRYGMFVMIPRPEPDNTDVTERGFY